MRKCEKSKELPIKDSNQRCPIDGEVDNNETDSPPTIMSSGAMRSQDSCHL